MILIYLLSSGTNAPTATELPPIPQNFFEAQKENITQQYNRHRLAFSNVVSRRLQRPFSFWWFSNNSMKCDIELQLHHLIANALHIINMKTDSWYRQQRRDIEKSNAPVVRILINPGPTYCQQHGYTLLGGDYYRQYKEPADVVNERNSQTDLASIINLFQNWEVLPQDNNETIIAFHQRVKTLEQQLSPYKNNRKMSFISWKNPEDYNNSPPSPASPPDWD